MQPGMSGLGLGAYCLGRRIRLLGFEFRVSGICGVRGLGLRALGLGLRI